MSEDITIRSSDGSPYSKRVENDVSEHDHRVDAPPSVAVIIPVRNEAAHLRRAVSTVLNQVYPVPFEVCLAVGPSSDGTEAVAAQLAAEEPRVRVVDNPSGLTPAALNAAIRATTSDIVVRVDGHSALSPGYIRTAVATIQRTGAVNVGGVQRPVGATPFERTVAAVMSSFAGTGGAAFHTGGAAGPVDTVYLGVFQRDALERAGLFDERLIRNQDYELNIRLRAGGGVVWFDPDLWVEYRPRGSFARLARQYLEYGRWKRAVLTLHPTSLKARQAAPAVVTALISGGLVVVPLSLWGLLPAAGYAVAATTAAAMIDRRSPLRTAAVLATMHLSWGAGFLTARPARLLGRGTGR